MRRIWRRRTGKGTLVLGLAVVALWVCVARPCLAQDDYDIKVYPCPRAEQALAVDGALDEPVWQDAPLVGGFTQYDKPELVDVQTFLRLLYDGKYLYLGVSCDEPLMDKLVPVAQARDSMEVFHGETIEVFVEPKHDHANYFQFGVNAAGSVYDSRGTDPTWSAKAIAATRLLKDRWTLELAVPWSDLGTEPTAGAVLGFNVCRDRYLGAARGWTNWAQTKANFHDPERFAHLVLSPTAEQLGALGAELRKGDRRGAVAIYGREGFSDTSYRALARDALTRLSALLEGLEKVRGEEADAATKAELQKRLQAYRDEIAPFRQRLDGRAALDAAEWTRMDVRVTQLTGELDDVIWAARLSALLGRI
jgi:hypothetical protein